MKKKLLIKTETIRECIDLTAVRGGLEDDTVTWSFTCETSNDACWTTNCKSRHCGTNTSQNMCTPDCTLITF